MDIFLSSSVDLPDEKQLKLELGIKWYPDYYLATLNQMILYPNSFNHMGSIVRTSDVGVGLIHVV